MDHVDDEVIVHQERGKALCMERWTERAGFHKAIEAMPGDPHLSAPA